MIFISHSSRNNDSANRLREWLVAQGWGSTQIYLDLDNLNAGERWRQALNDSGANCEAVIVCLSDDWLRSDECKREFNIAETLHKPIFPVYVETVTLPIPRFITDLQIASIVDPNVQTQGFEQLRLGLLKHGIGPRHFPWPPPDQPDRSVFRGLQTYEIMDAAIFFGRDASIGKALDEVRRLRDGASERALVILAASGAGKSSFLRAGLLARLKREDHEFVVLPVIRPELLPLSGALGLARSLSQATGRIVNSNAVQPVIDAFSALREQVIERLGSLPGADRERLRAKPATIVIPIDQAEELYQAGNTETQRFMALLAAVLKQDSNVVLVFTIRSNAFELLQRDRELAEVPLAAFNLPPIAVGMLGEVITGPALLAKPPIEIASELTQHLLTEANSPDALPWLSFALERLAIETGGSKIRKLTLEQYLTKVGGLSKVISSVADDAIRPLAREERDQLPWLLRQLVGVEASDQDVGLTLLRMTLDLEVLEKHPGSTALIEALISARILVEDRQPGTQIRSIRLAHEAVLRGWDKARSVVEDYRDYFKQRDALQTQFDAWRTGNGNLLREAPLYQAEALVKQYGEEIPAAVRGYVRQSRSAANRGRNIAYGVAGVMAMLFLVATALGLFARQAFNEAEANLQLALDQAAGGIELLVDGYDRGSISTGLLDQLLARSQTTVDRLPGEADDVSLARTHLLGVMSLANTTVGRASKGRELAERALPLAQTLLDKKPNDLERQRLLAIIQERLAEALYWHGQLKDAAEKARLGKDMLVRLTTGNRPDEKLLWELILAYQRLGDILRAQGNFPDATREYEAWLELAERLAAQLPSNPKWERGIAFAHQRLGETLLAQRAVDAATGRFRQYLDRLQRLEAVDPQNATYQEGLTFAHMRLGDALLEQRDYQGAHAAFQESHRHAARLLMIDPSNFRWIQIYNITYQRMGEARFRDKAYREALDTYREYLRLSQVLRNKDPSNKAPLYDISTALEKIGDALRELGDFEGAFNHYTDRHKLANDLVKLDPSNATWQMGLAFSHHRLGLVLRDQAKSAEAIVQFRECVRTAPKALTWAPRSSWPPDVGKACLDHLREMGAQP